MEDKKTNGQQASPPTEVIISADGLTTLSHFNDRNKGVITEAFTDLALGLDRRIYVDHAGSFPALAIYIYLRPGEDPYEDETQEGEEAPADA